MVAIENLFYEWFSYAFQNALNENFLVHVHRLPKHEINCLKTFHFVELIKISLFILSIYARLWDMFDRTTFESSEKCVSKAEVVFLIIIITVITFCNYRNSNRVAILKLNNVPQNKSSIDWTTLGWLTFKFMFIHYDQPTLASAYTAVAHHFLICLGILFFLSVQSFRRLDRFRFIISLLICRLDVLHGFAKDIFSFLFPLPAVHTCSDDLQSTRHWLL